jgi:hypothetical protein
MRMNFSLKGRAAPETVLVTSKAGLRRDEDGVRREVPNGLIL